LPAIAEQPLRLCDIVEDNDVAAPVEQNLEAAQVLERIQSDWNLRATDAAVAAQRLEAEGDDMPDKVVGHLRWVIRNNDGEPERTAYWLLNELGLGGRADVADQFIAGLNDEQASVRRTSADGLGVAPSSKRPEAWLALIGRLPKTSYPGAHHSVLDSLEQLASPDLKGGSDILLAEFKAGPPDGVSDGLLKEWKAKVAAALIGVRGPEEALAEFRKLDLDDPVERIATAGALQALTIYAGENFPEMDPERRDRLRDLLRDYGIDLLAKDDTLENAERNGDVRKGVAYLFVWAVLGQGEPRAQDVRAISAAVDAAVRVEPLETRAAELFSAIRTLLERKEFREAR
jgi:hypothetical protein